MKLQQPIHSHYTLPLKRLRSFDSWPPGLSQKPQEMADAGFFYTGQSDKVRCYYCDGGVKDWNPEDKPWEEHARFFQYCQYVLCIKGEEYIKYIARQPIQRFKEPTSHKRSEVELNTSKVVDINMSCKICFQEELCICFIPCGHAITCARCALCLNNICPLCRKPFNQYMKLYF